MHPNLKYWLALIYFKNLGLMRIKKLINHFDGIETFFKADYTALKMCGLNDYEIKMILEPDWASVHRDIAWAYEKDQHLICFQDERYPKLLKEIEDAPFVLFLKGNSEILTQHQLAIIGSRNASYHGHINAKTFAYHLAKQGLVITSGLALGIDGAAHQGAIDACGYTIAVMGTGLSYTYPKSHEVLADAILAEGGCLISEFPLSVPPIAKNFPKRNRIISGLTLGVLVVEAAKKSGSLITARHALDQGREVFAIPGSIHHVQAKGCHHLIKQGAKLVENAQDILEELGSLISFNYNNTSPFHPYSFDSKDDFNDKLSKQEVSILKFIGYNVVSTDMLLSQTSLTVNELSSMLLNLELKGVIRLEGGGYIRS